MKKNGKKPNLYVIAGPNGAGKTTFAREFLPNEAECLEFVNADLIAGGLSPFSPEKAVIRAGRIMLEQIHTLGNRGLDFGFETTLSGRTYIKLLHDLKKKGYQIHIFFLWLNSVELALGRIQDRVKSGGHGIPESVVRRRFHRSLSNFLHIYKPLTDTWGIYNNTGNEPEIIAFEEAGKLQIRDPALFDIISKSKVRQ